MSYKFVDNFNEPEPKNETTTSFLQLASFAHPKTKLYHVKKYTFNESNEIINVKDYYLTKSKYNRLIRKKNNTEYKLYSVYNLNEVGLPNLSDILMRKSNMLQSNYNYYGSAPF